jgi:hypothetical protein
MARELFFEEGAEIFLQIDSDNFGHEVFFARQQIQHQDFNVVECCNSIILRLCDGL